jgi:putative MATE family efflux protein
MTIILIGMFFHTAAMSMNVLIRAEGNAIVPMSGMIMGAVLNIILDTIFIISLDMGIKGAAWATVIAQIIPTIYFISYFLSGKSFLKIHPKNLAIEWGILKDILAIGIASFARTLATSFSAIVVNRLLVAYGGDIAVSAFGIVNRIMMFAMMPAMVFAQGLQPILGFNYGARRFDRALKIIRIAITISTVTSLIVFFILYFAPEPLISIFTTDTELINMGSYAAKRIFFVLYLIGTMMVGSLIFQSIGQAAKSFITSIARPFLFLMPCVFILPQFMDLEGVFVAFPIADILTFLLTLSLLIPTIREFRRAERQAGSEPPPAMPGQSGMTRPENIPAGLEIGKRPDAD